MFSDLGNPQKSDWVFLFHSLWVSRCSRYLNVMCTGTENVSFPWYVNLLDTLMLTDENISPTEDCRKSRLSLSYMFTTFFLLLTNRAIQEFLLDLKAAQS